MVEESEASMMGTQNHAEPGTSWKVEGTMFFYLLGVSTSFLLPTSLSHYWHFQQEHADYGERERETRDPVSSMSMH